LKAHTAPDLQVVPSQLLPPPLQLRPQVENVSHTTLVQCPLLAQPKVQVASWLHCTSSQVMPPPLQLTLQVVSTLHSAPSQLAPV
jgi:hypothetical protein